MTELPPLPRDQRKIDADHLNLLSIFHFVGAGLAVLGMGFVLLHFTLMHNILENPKMWENAKQSGGPPPDEFFAIFRWLYVIAGAWLVVSLVVNLLSGLYIRARKHRSFSMVVAAVNCLHMPLGTVLGVFTLVVLSRDSVREVYQAKAAD